MSNVGGDGRVTLRLYLEGDEICTLDVPGNTSATTLKELKDKLIAGGVCDEVRINGAPATADKLAEIVNEMNAKGSAIRIDGRPATVDTVFTQGSMVVVAKEQKGGCRTERLRLT
jgi:hypothetical protein